MQRNNLEAESEAMPIKKKNDLYMGCSDLLLKPISTQSMKENGNKEMEELSKGIDYSASNGDEYCGSENDEYHVGVLGQLGVKRPREGEETTESQETQTKEG